MFILWFINLLYCSLYFHVFCSYGCSILLCVILMVRFFSVLNEEKEIYNSRVIFRRISYMLALLFINVLYCNLYLQFFPSYVCSITPVCNFNAPFLYCIKSKAIRNIFKNFPVDARVFSLVVYLPVEISRRLWY